MIRIRKFLFEKLWNKNGYKSIFKTFGAVTKGKMGQMNNRFGVVMYEKNKSK